MSDWQPIETIPKGDGCEGPLVLVWLPGDGYPWVARWVQGYGKEEICSTYSECMGSWTVSLNEGSPSYRAQFSPTHWMPLPEPPG